MNSRLTEADVKTYLVRVYFGPVNDAPIRKAVERSYRDFNRTLRGFAIHPERTDAHRSASEYLQQQLHDLESAQISSAADFDAWHQATCNGLKSFYGEFPFSVGQAQKWINMAIKYIFVLDRSRVEAVWQYCHVPIDKILLRLLGEQGHDHPPIIGAWSRLDDYSRYLDFQVWFRNEFSGAPMDNEFEMWK